MADVIAALPVAEKRAVADIAPAAPAAAGGKVAKDWEWSPDTNIRPLTDLIALLNHPEHPAKLCMEPKAKYPLAYIHIWNEKKLKYERSFHTTFAARKTVSGIQYGKLHKDYNITFEITSEEWGILGKTAEFAGTLISWIADELFKDPAFYFGEEAAFMMKNPMFPPEVRKAMILNGYLKVAAKPSGPATIVDPTNKDRRIPKPGKEDVIYSPSLRVKIDVDRDINLPKIDVFKVNDPEPAYYLPGYDGPDYDKNNENTKKSALAPWIASVQGLNLPSPCELVKPQSTNDLSCTILGISIKGSAWQLCTRAMQIVCVEAAKEYVDQKRGGKPTCRIPGRQTVAVAVAVVAVAPVAGAAVPDAIIGGGGDAAAVVIQA